MSTFHDDASTKPSELSHGKSLLKVQLNLIWVNQIHLISDNWDYITDEICVTNGYLIK